MKTLIKVFMVIFLFSILLYGCSGVGVWKTKHVGKGYGPPPHAPAHGYRHKHHGADLVFDTGLGVYVVTGRPDHYFHGENFYRFRDGGWWMSVDLGGPWVTIGDSDVPPLLMKKKGKAYKKHKKPHKWK